MAEYVIEMKNISKSFPGVKALSGINLQVKKGEVQALMGENGAGKSTLMKILNGIYQPDEGHIYFNGKKVKIDGPTKALNMGICMIYQELNPIPDMTVAENIFIGREPRYRHTCFVDFPKMYQDAASLLKKYNMVLNPKAKVSTLSTAQKQMLEIIKAVSNNVSVIAMDEPTSSLTEEEVKILFNTIKYLKSTGVPVIYISHRIEEVFEIADLVTVLRDGQYIGTEDIKSVNKDKLISMMVGRALTDIYLKQDVQPGETVLEVKNLNRQGKFYNINFQVKRGEILGISGLVGAGRSEVLRAIFGIDPIDSGEIILEGKRLSIKSPNDAIKNGIAMVTEDRKELGLVLCRSIRENISLVCIKRFCKGLFIRKHKELECYKDIIRDLAIKMSNINQLAQNLSGGNQQKVVLAKWLIKNPKLLILDEPTRGIDVGAKAEIHKMMSEFAKDGMTIIMISSELPEIMGMSDRILVMGEGKIKGEFSRNSVTQNDILACALGGVSLAE